MKATLGSFQDAFVESLYQRPAAELQAVTEQPGFDVYRNTVLKGCIDALCDNFPSVARLVGTDWLREAAAIHSREVPPNDSRLVLYGEHFAAFLDAFEPARAMPYLADVARLDWLWLEAFTAPQEVVLQLSSLAGMTVSDLATCRLQPRASARWRWFHSQPIYTIWRHNRKALPLREVLPWHGEGALLVGHPEGVAWQALEVGGCVFLDACANGQDLEQASALALDAQPNLDFTVLLSSLLDAAVFRPLKLP